MHVAFLGLGGGGVRTMKEFYRWLTIARGAGDASEGGPSQDVSGAWQFQHWTTSATQGRVADHSVGFVALDSFAGSLFRDMQPLPQGIGYKLAEEEGFGGDRRRATQVIEAMQRRLEEYSLPGPRSILRAQQATPSLRTYMRDNMKLGLSEVTVPCVSLVGGTGRGVYDLLSGYWNDIFEPTVPNIMITVVPGLAELQNVRLAKEATAYLGVLKRSLTYLHSGSVVLASYDLAQAVFAAMGEPDRLDELHLKREALNNAIRAKDRSNVMAGLGELAQMDVPQLVAGQYGVDAGIAVSMLPLFSNCFGAFSTPQYFIQEPKGLDPNDIGKLFRGHFVVPCYMETLAPLGTLLSQLEREMGMYHALGVPNPNVLTWLTHLALTTGSLLPLGFDIERSNHVAASVLALVWVDDPSFGIGELNGISQFLRRTLNVAEPTICLIRGQDPVANYVAVSKKGRDLSKVHARLWLYVLVNNDQPARNLIDLAGR